MEGEPNPKNDFLFRIGNLIMWPIWGALIFATIFCAYNIVLTLNSGLDNINLKFQLSRANNHLLVRDFLKLKNDTPKYVCVIDEYQSELDFFENMKSSGKISQIPSIISNKWVKEGKSELVVIGEHSKKLSYSFLIEHDYNEDVCFDSNAFLNIVPVSYLDAKGKLHASKALKITGTPLHIANYRDN